MWEILVSLFLDLLEVNIVAAVIILFLNFFAGKFRKRYGAGWMKIIWILLAVRLLIPYNFSIVPLAGISFAGAEGAVSDSVSSADIDDVSNISLTTGAGSQQDLSAGFGHDIFAQNDTSPEMTGSHQGKAMTTLPDRRRWQIR